MEGMTTDLIVALGPAAGVLILSIYFIRSFIAFQKETIGDILDTMKEDRKVFEQAVEKIDRRLEILERLFNKS
tara:strand:+ start:779 stop:997 length:219 start_codon:yes stop_codon:yes gene_type:complete